MAKMRYNIEGTYLDYIQSLKIYLSLKEIINVKPDIFPKLKPNVQINCFVKFILKTDEEVGTYMMHLFQWTKRPFQ